MSSQQLYGQPTPAPVVRTYVAESYEAAIRDFEADAQVMAQHGYQPTSQQWVPDDAGRGCFWLVVVVVLFVTIIGILFLPFVMGDRKKGTLTVTYTYVASVAPPPREAEATKVEPIVTPAPTAPEPRPAASSDRPTKVCPDCAESILEAARLCRFCRHEFWPEGAPPPTSAAIDEPEATTVVPADTPPTSEAMMGRDEMVPAQEPQPELQPPLAEPQALPPEPQPAPAWERSEPQPRSEPQAPQPPAPPADGPPAPPPYAPQQPPYTPQQPTYPPPPPTWQPPAQGQPPRSQPPGQAPQPQGQGPWVPPPPRPPDRPRS